MSEQLSVDPLRALIDCHARDCLTELLAGGATPVSDAVVMTNGKWSVLLAVYRTPPEGGVPSLTTCERDCLVMLAKQEEAVSAHQLWEKLLNREDTRKWAEITIKRSLVRLKKHGQICTTRKGPRGSRGYWLPKALRPRYRRDSA
jgi:hypothetical protein